MREPKLYGPYRDGSYYVHWYEKDENGVQKLKRKQLGDAVLAELLFEEKRRGAPIDTGALLLKEVLEIKKMIPAGEVPAKLYDLEQRLEKSGAENRRLSDELATLKSRTPRTTEPVLAGFQSKVLVIPLAFFEALKNKGATRPEAISGTIVIQQLSYLLQNGFGKVLGDGRTYIYGKYEDLQSSYFPIWSPRTVERNLVMVEKLGLVDSAQPEGRFSRRKYYTLSPEAAKLAASDKQACSKRQLGGFPQRAKEAASLYTENKNPTKKHGHGDHALRGGVSRKKTERELTLEEKDLMNQVEELTEVEGRAEHFRKLWEELVQEDPISVFKAIGETKMKKRQGEIRKSIGGALLFNYRLFHTAREQRKRAENNPVSGSA